MEFEGSPAVDSFTISPLNPSPDQSYAVEAKIDCYPTFESPITSLSVRGTDDYTDTVSNASALVSMSVPGAEDGVKDIIKLMLGDQVLGTKTIVFRIAKFWLSFLRVLVSLGQ